MDDGLLRDAVARALDVSAVDRLEVARAPIDYDAFMPGRTLSRLGGTAWVGGRATAWSLVEKTTDPAPVAPPFIREGGRRELFTYRSGLLDDLGPDVVAPRSMGHEEAQDGRLRLLLEDVADERTVWSDEDWVRAARHLGRMAASWRARPLPEAPWLLVAWTDRHAQPEAMDEGRRIFAELGGHPAAVARLGPVAGADGLRLIDASPRLVARLAALPHVLCHHDAVRSNLFVRTRGTGLETVAIDWESVGPGPVGADLASLLFSSVRRGDLDGRLLADVAPAVLQTYAEELRRVDAGAAEASREGFAASVSLRWSLLRDVVRSLATGGPLARGRRMGEPPERTVDELVTLCGFLLDMARSVGVDVARSPARGGSVR